MIQATHAQPAHAPIEALRRLLVRERPVYHAFASGGVHLLYDLCSGALVELNPATYALLRGLEEGEPGPRILGALAQAGGVRLEEFAAELHELHRLGLFRSEPFDAAEARRSTLEALRRHAPRNVMLLVQTSCNLACDYCYEVLSGFHFTGGKMPFATARAILDHYLERARPRKAITVTFFGGEPLLNFEVVSQCVDHCDRHARDHGQAIGYSLTTNGTLLTAEIIRYLVEHEFAVMLSIDGDPRRADVHRHDHRGRGATARAVANGKLLVDAQRRAGVREACVRATLTQENGSHVETYDYLHRQGFRRILIGHSAPRAHHPAHPWDIAGAAADRLTGEGEALLHAYAQARCPDDLPPAARELSKGLAEIREALARPQLQPLIGCGVGNNMLAYAADGGIFPCHRFVNEEGFRLGTLGGGGPEPERLARFYSDIIEVRSEVCGRCWARFVCKGKCPWELAAPDGRVRAEAPESCDGLRASFERKLWLYHRTCTDPTRTTAEQEGSSHGS